MMKRHTVTGLTKSGREVVVELEIELEPPASMGQLGNTNECPPLTTSRQGQVLTRSMTRARRHRLLAVSDIS